MSSVSLLALEFPVTAIVAPVNVPAYTACQSAAVGAVFSATESDWKAVPPACPGTVAFSAAPPLGVTATVRLSVEPVSLCRCTTRSVADLSSDPDGIAAGGAYPLTVSVVLSFFLPFHEAKALSPAVARFAAVAPVKLPAFGTPVGFNVLAPFRFVVVSAPDVRPYTATGGFVRL